MTGSTRRARRLPRLLVVLAMLAASLAAFPAGVAAAGSSVVTNCADGLTPVPPGSLRAAVGAANGDGDSTADDPHVITFALDLACDTIVLAGTQLTLTNHVDIQGPGASVLTVSGNDASRVFEVAEDATATMSGLTFAAGNAHFGGGIHNAGTLAIAGSTVSGNSATATNEGNVIVLGGGIHNAGTLAITNSTVSGNSAIATVENPFEDGAIAVGGGIYNEGTLVISGSTLSGNSATVPEALDGFARGGGIYNEGTLEVSGSTLSGNSATIVAFDAEARGGGIYSDIFTATLVISSSTISGNSVTATAILSFASAAGGGIFNGGALADSGSTISSSTISGNSVTASGLLGSSAIGGGIITGGTLEISSSTISGNSATSSGGLFGDGSLGGGIANFGESILEITLEVIGSTISGNSVTAVDSDDARGGGIYNLGDATLAGTLLAGNTGGNCSDDAVSSDGYNLSDDDTCTLTGTGDLDDNPNANLDPVLDDNGGPTLTHALLDNSVAIDAIPLDGSAGCGTTILTDQRGMTRPHGDGCDIGSFEVQDQTPPVIILTLDPAVPDGLNGWYVSDITVTWTVTDDESDVSVDSGCVDEVIAADTAGYDLDCVASSEGGTTTFETVTVKRDATPPTVTAPEDMTVVSPSSDPVVVNYPAATAEDALSGVAEAWPSCYPLSGTLFAVGVTEVECAAEDNAGNVGTNSFYVTVVRDWMQGCLFAGSLSQVSVLGFGNETTVTCARGEPVVLEQGDDYYGCLYAGSLSQVGTNPPSSCGRGTPIGLATGDDLWACLFAGRLSQVGYTEPLNCGRGEAVGFGFVTFGQEET